MQDPSGIKIDVNRPSFKKNDAAVSVLLSGGASVERRNSAATATGAEPEESSTAATRRQREPKHARPITTVVKAVLAQENQHRDGSGLTHTSATLSPPPSTNTNDSWTRNVPKPSQEPSDGIHRDNHVPIVFKDQARSFCKPMQVRVKSKALPPVILLPAAEAMKTPETQPGQQRKKSQRQDDGNAVYNTCCCIQ